MSERDEYDMAIRERSRANDLASFDAAREGDRDRPTSREQDLRAYYEQYGAQRGGGGGADRAKPY
jgi:hypothetical protein